MDGLEATPSTELLTLAERTDFRQTGRFEEVERICKAYTLCWPDRVRCFQFGCSAEGRPLLALVLSGSGALDADRARLHKLPVLMVQAGIHPGESDGKDAGFIALRDLLESRTALRKVVILFVPVLNPDGHERFGPYNRPNQNGPEMMGWRTNAQNLDLNRDYAKADTPEMQALLRLIEHWDPLLCADTHVGDGADFQHDVSIQVEPVHMGAPELFATGSEIRHQVVEALTKQGSLPLTFYPVLAQPDDPTAGFVDYVFSPRLSTGYWPMRNRFTLLVETHSWKDYRARVRVTRNVIVNLAEVVGERGQLWRDQVTAADQSAEKLGDTVVALDYGLSDEVETIEFSGYAYTRRVSPISGALMTAFDPARPEIWRVPFKGNIRATLAVRAPRGGYIVPTSHSKRIGKRLELHGIRVHKLGAAISAARVQTFRATSVKFAAQSFEGRRMMSVLGEWRDETMDVPAGSLYVPMTQAKARLVMALLEPRAPDSFAAWGFFSAAFERKEHMEAYVAEAAAQEMVTNSPALEAEFHRKLTEDFSFVRDPAARLDFFYQRHPSWDTRFCLYPIYRTEGL